VGIEESLAAEFAALLPHLNERQRRLALGARARSLGYGGVRVVARAAGVSAVTVSKGVAELQAGGTPVDRVRRPGGGRKRANEADPGLERALRNLVEPAETSSPESALLWTTKSTRKLASELTKTGHAVSAWTVARLLREQGFSLRASAQQLKALPRDDRDAQFWYLHAQAEAHLKAVQPVISVETRKTEQFSRLTNDKAKWPYPADESPPQADGLPNAALGEALHDEDAEMAVETGWQRVSVDHDTLAFAITAIRTWWELAGRASFPKASRLLICTDEFRSSSYAIQRWEAGLARLATQFSVEITCCHLPPATSKWSKIERRQLCRTLTSWRSQPPVIYEAVVSLIGNTETCTAENAPFDPTQFGWEW
jgi:transposase